MIKNLPALKGSKKQIEWANDLREEFINGVPERFKAKGNNKVFNYVLESKTDAKWWIKNRFLKGFFLLKDVYKEDGLSRDFFK